MGRRSGTAAAPVATPRRLPRPGSRHSAARPVAPTAPAGTARCGAGPPFARTAGRTGHGSAARRRSAGETRSRPAGLPRQIGAFPPQQARFTPATVVVVLGTYFVLGAVVRWVQPTIARRLMAKDPARGALPRQIVVVLRDDEF